MHCARLIFFCLWPMTALAGDLDAIRVVVPDAEALWSDFADQRSRDLHRALDIKAEKGARVRAFASGVIHGTGKHATAGKWVDIDHGNGWMTRYLHLHRIKVKRGQTIRAGQLVGKVGDTGNAKASGPHLHFELVKAGVKKDPLPALKRFLRTKTFFGP